MDAVVCGGDGGAGLEPNIPFPRGSNGDLDAEVPKLIRGAVVVIVVVAVVCGAGDVV